MRLQDKVIIVTGAASGMDLAMTQLFTQEGAKIIAADWNAERLNTTVTELQGKKAQVIAVQGDISNQQSAEGLIDRAVQEFGRLDVLVNNAGVMVAGRSKTSINRLTGR